MVVSLARAPRWLAFALLCSSSIGVAGQQSGPRPWQVEDNVRLWRLPQWYHGHTERGIAVSPDRRLVAVLVLQPQVGSPTTRAVLNVYRQADVRQFAAGGARPVSLLQLVAESDRKKMALRQLSWAPQENQLALVRRGSSGDEILLWKEGWSAPRSMRTADRDSITRLLFLPGGSRLAMLTRTKQSIGRDPTNLTGVSFFDAMEMGEIAESEGATNLSTVSTSELTIRNFDLSFAGGRGLWPSPDGRYLGVMVPGAFDWTGKCWRRRLVDRSAPSQTTIDLSSTTYAILDLSTGRLANAASGPVGELTGIHASLKGGAAPFLWSADSRHAVIPYSLGARNSCNAQEYSEGAGAYLLPADGSTIQELFRYPSSWKEIFVSLAQKGRSSRFSVSSADDKDHASTRTFLYSPRSSSLLLEAAKETSSGEIASLFVKEGLNSLPALTARSSKGDQRELEPFFRGEQAEIERATEITWQDSRDRSWRGLLMVPSGNRQPFPLLLQTHGYNREKFAAEGSEAGGTFPGRAALARGFVILTVEEINQDLSTPNEAAEVLDGYRSGIEHLVRRGIVDRSRVGFIGWSRSGYWGLYAAAMEPNLFKAAVIADNIDFGYLQYILFYPNRRDLQPSWDGIYKGSPWTARSNWSSLAWAKLADKIVTPIRFEGYSGIASVPQEWEGYASLAINQVPTELWRYPEGPHGLARPSDQMASELGNLDWLDFWINGHEEVSSDPDQYMRWREMRHRWKRDAL